MTVFRVTASHSSKNTRADIFRGDVIRLSEYK